jgi:pseudouridylate synthase
VQLQFNHNEEVSDALADGRAVVALESTLISHGLPHPDNLECAQLAEQAVRNQGATPATIGIIGGSVVIGLCDTHKQRLADAGTDARKVSRRDLAFAIAQKLDGSTTVAATMICAARAGIEVFATGGIGGVHRGVQQTMDISADLSELARTRVAVVCAGAKIILDLPRTLEALETAGVPVVGLGCEQFPAFFVADSGLPIDQWIEAPSTGELQANGAAPGAAIIAAQRDLGLNTGILFVNPPPAHVAIDHQLAEAWIRTALTNAEHDGVQGKAVTPYLLEKIRDLSGGDSLTANVALIENNAKVAAQLAVAYASLRALDTDCH